MREFFGPIFRHLEKVNPITTGLDMGTGFALLCIGLNNPVGASIGFGVWTTFTLFELIPQRKKPSNYPVTVEMTDDDKTLLDMSNCPVAVVMTDDKTPQVVLQTEHLLLGKKSKMLQMYLEGDDKNKIVIQRDARQLVASSVRLLVLTYSFANIFLNDDASEDTRFTIMLSGLTATLGLDALVNGSQSQVKLKSCCQKSLLPIIRTTALTGSAIMTGASIGVPRDGNSMLMVAGGMFALSSYAAQVVAPSRYSPSM